MNWGLKDLEKIRQSMEYIDTVVLPLLPVSLGKNMGQAALMSDFVNLLSLRLERLYHGRILLLPGFIYLQDKPSSYLIEELQGWEQVLHGEGFKHVVYLTADPEWRLRENQLTGSLIWLPALSLQKLSDTEQLAILDEQVNQISPIFRQKWT